VNSNPNPDENDKGGMTTTFFTPSDFTLNGVEAEIVWNDTPEATEGVYIIVDDKASRVTDILADPNHPQHDVWTEWDDDIFYYCESEQEWKDILSNGHHDGWRVVQ
jgi:hypothetical protein